MTTKEKARLNVHLDNQYSLTKHTLFRKQERRVTTDEINSVFENYEIIEYHYKDANRLLLRGKIIENGNVNICIVVDINSKEIVTVYYNSIADKHLTLNLSNYIHNISILSMLN